MKLGAQIDHLHKGMLNNTSTWIYDHRDPMFHVHIQHNSHLVEDKHKHELSGIFDHDIPTLHKNHKLHPKYWIYNYNKNNFIYCFYIIHTTNPIPVVWTPGCLTTQSPDFIRHLILPQLAHWGKRCKFWQK